MFKFSEFEKVLYKDNPRYERIKTSDLHDLVALLESKASPSAEAVGKEMKKIKKEKWKKYARTRSYLLEEFPDLRAKLVKFKTKSLGKGAAGAINHVLTWESDSGDLDDIDHIRVREHVSWGAPDREVAPYVIGEYAKGGHHYGQGNAAFTPGNVGQGDDTHAALGPFSPKVLEFKGPGALRYEMEQVYEMSDDGGKTWSAIPKSKYKILRVVTFEDNKIKLSIAKGGGAGEKVANSTSI
ncbi:MAG: hypothetical protein AB7Q97_19055 [Gammaproteobacteria bacterium]